MLPRMSLTSLVRLKSPVRERMAADFPRPKLRLDAELCVPSVAPSPALMGTAFDYLLRFHLLRAMAFATSRRWVAEHALVLIGELAEEGALVVVGEEFQAAKEVRERMERIIRRAKKTLAEFLAGEPLSIALVRAAINLAHCDTYYRIGRLDQRFGNPHRAQIEELRRLIEVADLQSLTATDRCFLNPVFGEGSVMLGGADADLLIDDLLVDVKTTATLKIRTEDWRQLIGYAALNEHFPIGGGEQPVAIRRVGFYFSRYSYLASWPLVELVDAAKFTAFGAWLRDYAMDTHARRLARRAEFEREAAEWLEKEERRQQRERARKARRKKFAKGHRPPKVKAKRKAQRRAAKRKFTIRRSR